MKYAIGLAILVALIPAAGCGGGASPAPAIMMPHGALVDLSHAYDDKTVFWPTSDPFRLQKVADGMTDGGYYYAANNFSMAEHGGTHIDAPIHFAAGGQTVDRIPLDHLMGDAIVVDVQAQCDRDRDYQIAVDDLVQWEKQNGEIGLGTIVLFRTGFSRRWPDAATYLGTAARGESAVAALHFPGLHPDAARWLVKERQINAVGIDTASIDYGQSTLFESHRTLFEQNVPAFENLAALDRLPARGAVVIALPMKIAGGSGGPLRAVAMLPR